jgi:hypothetical protein
VPPASAVPAPTRAPSHVGTGASRTVAAVISGCVRTSRSSPAGRRRPRKKILSDDPRGPSNRLFLGGVAVPDALPVAPTLPVPFLFARPRGSVGLLALPPRPFPRRLPASIAAIALPRLPGTKALLTSFEQTAARPRPTFGALPPLARCCPLILERVCRIFRRAHGRWCSQKLMPRRGTLLLSGALPIADSLAPPRTHQSVPLSTILTLPQNSVAEIHSLIVVPSSPPSSLGGIVPTHPAIMDPSSPPLTLLVRGKERNSLTIRKSQ